MHIIAQINCQHSMAQIIYMLRVLNREDDFYPMIDARHEISTAHVDLFLAIIVEIIQTAMLQIAPYDTDHLDIIADTFETGSQTTHAAHKQIHFYARLGCLIEQLNELYIHNRVGFEDQVPVTPRLSVLDLTAN